MFGTGHEFRRHCFYGPAAHPQRAKPLRGFTRSGFLCALCGAQGNSERARRGALVRYFRGSGWLPSSQTGRVTHRAVRIHPFPGQSAGKRAIRTLATESGFRKRRHGANDEEWKGWKAIEPASHPFPFLLEIPSGFPHSHRFDEGIDVSKQLQKQADWL